MPEFDVMPWKYHWDKTTQEVIEKRISEVPTQTFFDDSELRAVAKIIEAVIPGIHEDIPIKEILGRKIEGSEKKGVRPVDLPWRPQMYKQGLSFLDKESKATFSKGVADLTFDETTALLEKTLQEQVNKDIWEFPSDLFSQAMIADIAAIYYSFPHAWNEIQFAGPAYPYGYYALGCDEKMEYEPELGESGNE